MRRFAGLGSILYTDLIKNLTLAWWFHISDHLIFYWIVEFQFVHAPCFNPTIFVNLLLSSPLQTSPCISHLFPLSEDLPTWIVRKNPRPAYPFATALNIALLPCVTLDVFHCSAWTDFNAHSGHFCIFWMTCIVILFLFLLL